MIHSKGKTLVLLASDLHRKKRLKTRCFSITKSKTIILDSFKKRINNSLDKEFMNAKQQVEKIASFRLKDLVK